MNCIWAKMVIYNGTQACNPICCFKRTGVSSALKRATSPRMTSHDSKWCCRSESRSAVQIQRQSEIFLWMSGAILETICHVLHTIAPLDEKKWNRVLTSLSQVYKKLFWATWASLKFSIYSCALQFCHKCDVGWIEENFQNSYSLVNETEFIKFPTAGIIISKLLFSVDERYWNLPDVPICHLVKHSRIVNDLLQLRKTMTKNDVKARSSFIYLYIVFKFAPKSCTWPGSRRAQKSFFSGIFNAENSIEILFGVLIGHSSTLQELAWAVMKLESSRWLNRGRNIWNQCTGINVRSKTDCVVFHQSFFSARFCRSTTHCLPICINILSLGTIFWRKVGRNHRRSSRILWFVTNSSIRLRRGWLMLRCPSPPVSCGFIWSSSWTTCDLLYIWHDFFMLNNSSADILKKGIVVELSLNIHRECLHVQVI